jgi:hypothetical protein
MSTEVKAARPYVRRGPVFETPVGGKVRRDPLKKGYAWVVCPDCPESENERYVKIPHGGEELRKFTGRCERHTNISQRTLTGVHKHRSGAIYDYDDRDPENTTDNAAFICANFVNKKGCSLPDGKSYGWMYQFKQSTWQGLCKNCVTEWLRQQKKITDDLPLYDDPLDPEAMGTVVCYSEENEKGVPVRHRRCLHAPRFPRRSIQSRLVALKKKRRWPALCSACRVETDEAIQAAAGNGNEQKNDELAQKLLEDVNAVIAVWEREKSPNIPIDEQFTRVTQEKVSRYVGGPAASKGLFGSRLRRHKVNLLFPEAKSWYDDFVEFVVRGFEKGTAAGEIVSSLIQRQKVKKTLVKMAYAGA